MNDKSYAAALRRSAETKDGLPSTALPPARPTLDDAALADQLRREFEAQDLEDARIAADKQREYEEEHIQLISQFEELKAGDPGSFDCGICLETQSTFALSRIDPCGHLFCRECLRLYLQSKLGEQRFPILCPVCLTEKDRRDPGTLNDDIAHTVGITEKEYETYVELQMASFSILLHCRKCSKSVFVDRREYEEAKLIVCPLPTCNYLWCKDCSREVDIATSVHSCDGTSELNDLMDRRGWKHCPGCSTPVEKTQGCNHMTCMSAGCNTHFCYKCGQTIVRSVKLSDIRSHVSAHYGRCALFSGRVYEQ
ncbi:hypothetical protein PUNSTDRAFT_96055 [Punctularia strigosozonata HHB-11173 SS5]|uniref:uncharacterized protein n=1 Tax=Punctularia strigosozonata (strain HHB-11173) TaxID=741275 RepID=UPI0004416F9A|nr:uncharacterized protein PUNSTDRAFT_96055 [Punctularia strigosozonata HHB-11173 SS5]EIN14301.1 hypothetical protein PUNSTDRAFT_96055 [Punctularia strigosozonata HHB-11173 SS5]